MAVDQRWPLQRAEDQCDPIPFDVEVARIHGRICGRRRLRRPQAPSPCGRPGDRRRLGRRGDSPSSPPTPGGFKGLDDLIAIVPVIRRENLRDR